MTVEPLSKTSMIFIMDIFLKYMQNIMFFHNFNIQFLAIIQHALNIQKENLRYRNKSPQLLHLVGFPELPYFHMQAQEEQLVTAAAKRSIQLSSR